MVIKFKIRFDCIRIPARPFIMIPWDKISSFLWYLHSMCSIFLIINYNCSLSSIVINKCNDTFNTSRSYRINYKRIEINDKYLNNYGIRHLNREFEITVKIKTILD